jgi:hypothetical protein
MEPSTGSRGNKSGPRSGWPQPPEDHAASVIVRQKPRPYSRKLIRVHMTAPPRPLAQGWLAFAGSAIGVHGRTGSSRGSVSNVGVDKLS